MIEGRKEAPDVQVQSRSLWGGGGRLGQIKSVDGFVFFRLYFCYSDLQLFAIFILEVFFFGDISCDKC